MVNFTILQVVLLTLLAFIKHVDYYGIPMIFVNYAVFWGLITGVVMGDWKTGLVIGGTIQLMQLGVAGFGGSSIPDYGTMAIIATAYGVTLGSDAFFPFGDNVERARKSGVSYIVEPGGSIRDDNVIETANKYGITMAFTGMRLFHH